VRGILLPDVSTGYDASTYGERIAEIYDRWPRVPQNADTVVEFLAAIAGRGPVLELGIGTGRIALPLARRGLEVHGIDASPSMVARLRAKPGGEAIPVALGDFAAVPIEGRFSLVFVVFNTFFGLLTQEAQVDCFAAVSRHLTGDGVFVIEAFVPDLSRFSGEQRVEALSVETDRVVLATTMHDRAAQRVVSQQVLLSAGDVRLYPVELRYAWPSELDLMARLAGLQRRERWGGWNREPFSGASAGHVSVYERRPGA
jgi:SAM-dependent methyltransferase